MELCEHPDRRTIINLEELKRVPEEQTFQDWGNIESPLTEDWSDSITKASSNLDIQDLSTKSDGCGFGPSPLSFEMEAPRTKIDTKQLIRAIDPTHLENWLPADSITTITSDDNDWTYTHSRGCGRWSPPLPILSQLGLPLT